MIDPSASPTAPGAPESSSRGWWVGRRLVVSVLFVIAIALPGFIVSLGASRVVGRREGPGLAVQQTRQQATMLRRTAVVGDRLVR